jgi:hypothetical protein
LLRFAEQQLAACGKEAFEQEIHPTREILTHEIAAAIASATDPRSYRLTATGPALAWSESHRFRRSAGPNLRKLSKPVEDKSK